MQEHSNLTYLFRQLVARELLSRYRATAMGTFWLVFQPLLMLVVYTVVFSGIFKVRWSGAQTTAGFGLMLFAGLVVFNFFAEVLVSAPSLVTSQPNYVKKVVFPVEVLGAVRVAAAASNALIGMLILLVAQFAVAGGATGWFLLAPVLLLCMVPLLLGVAWLLSALGVYLQDTSQFAGLLASMLLFVSPIFFPASAIPASLQALSWANPLVIPIEQFRNVTVYGNAPDWAAVLLFLVVSCAFAMVSLRFFKRLSPGFADVL